MSACLSDCEANAFTSRRSEGITRLLRAPAIAAPRVESPLCGSLLLFLKEPGDERGHRLLHLPSPHRGLDADGREFASALLELLLSIESFLPLRPCTRTSCCCRRRRRRPSRNPCRATVRLCCGWSLSSRNSRSTIHGAIALLWRRAASCSRRRRAWASPHDLVGASGAKGCG